VRAVSRRLLSFREVGRHCAEQRVRGFRPAIAAEGMKRRCVPDARVCRTSIRYADHVESAISTITDRVIHALVGEEAGRDDRVETDIAHKIFEVR
jgi:hypothetical protein